MGMGQCNWIQFVTEIILLMLKLDLTQLLILLSIEICMLSAYMRRIFSISAFTNGHVYIENISKRLVLFGSFTPIDLKMVKNHLVSN